MEICLTVALIALALCAVGIAPFEGTLALLLLTPICAYPLGLLLPAGKPLYVISFAFLLTLLMVLSKGRSLYSRDEALQALLPVGYFVVCFSVFSYLCHSWPDFYQLGERLRDFAVLSAVIKSPIEAREPWLSGFPLNYYLYWYRFGHMLSSVLKLPIWEVYHQLQAFTFALFSTSIFVLFRKYAKFPVWGALFTAAIITLGSNAEGILYFIKNDPNWWGPSRVIPGAINEFPAWSFLLGDVHPHYLNLGLIPFLLGIFLCVSRSTLQIGAKLYSIVGILAVGTLWSYNANAWELPVWLGLSAAIFTSSLAVLPVAELRKIERRDFLSLPAALIVALVVYLAYSLALSSLNIVPAHMPLKLVEMPVPRTSALDLLRHWGIPLAIIILSSILSLRKIEWMVIAALAFGLAFATRSAIVVLTLTFVLAALIAWNSRKEPGSASLSNCVFTSMGLLALLLIIFPELAFLDDSYGGENERMNTIFKAYSAAWFLLHGFAFYLLAKLPRAWLNRFPDFPLLPLVLVVGILWIGFFFRTIKLRKSSEFGVQPAAQGLSDIERRFPGSATTIQILTRSRPGIVLEAQGPAYDFTSHIATLSSQTAYLGWANHINLLLQVYPEVSRREKITEDMYREADCAKKKTLATQERINYIVLGPLEKRAFPEANAEQFSCFKELIRSKEYLVFENQ
ncbi:MAG: hypothetical protein J0M12_00455 [Deltaproteobacteria bacterium]|nr:hypothetical protein [Deltaproteobacteria bacterium]